MKAFTIQSNLVKPFIDVEGFTLSNGLVIPAVTVGEKGRGRWLGVLPVSGVYTEDKKVEHFDLGQTNSGKPKLVPAVESDDSQCVIRFLTHIGFRGDNLHTGDWYRNPVTGEKDKEQGKKPFPGQILVEGRIAQGDAGGMGSGDQLIAVLNKGDVFRIAYGGRLYGAPAVWYGWFDGDTVQYLTADDYSLYLDNV